MVLSILVNDNTGLPLTSDIVQIFVAKHPDIELIAFTL